MKIMIFRKSILTIVLLAIAGTVQGQASSQLDSVILKTKSDIDSANAELQSIRDMVTAERIPLADKLQALEKEIKALRQEIVDVKDVQQKDARDYAELVSDFGIMKEQAQFVITVFSEYRRAMETRASESEALLLHDSLKIVDDNLNEKDLFAALPRALDVLLSASAKWNRQRVGGMIFDGSALDDKGFEHDGRFVNFGPVSFFASLDKNVNGIAVTGKGNAVPLIFTDLTIEEMTSISSVNEKKISSDQLFSNISALVSMAETAVPVDVTSGNALKIAQSKETLAEHMSKGGVVMFPLLGVGILSAILAFVKAVDLSCVRVKNNNAISNILSLLNSNKPEEAIIQAQKLKKPLQTLVLEAIEHRDAPREHMEEILYENVQSYYPRLEKYLGIIAVFGGIAPLLGLLGTVTGMIHTFQLVNIFGTGDPKLLSGGISESLVTTEFGLIVAIPVLLVHALLSRRAKNIALSLEQTAVNLINQIHVRKSV